MSLNIMNQYIEKTKKQIETYMKLVLENEYKKEYCDLLIEKYINVRYYNFYADDITGTTRKKIMLYLKDVEESLIIRHIDDRELIEKMVLLFYYVLYFDNVIQCDNLHDKIIRIKKLCMKIGIYKNEEFWSNLYNKMKDFMIEKEVFLDNFLSDEFTLKLSHYSNSNRVNRVNLKYNIKFPMEYSSLGIKKAFDTGIVNEDKLIVEYSLVSVQVIKDIIKNNFNREYIVEFADSLLKKSRKIDSILNILDNFIVQEKVALKIRYEQYLENKDKVLELMRNGYKIAVVLDGSFEIENIEIEKLKIFKFVIINSELKYYNEFLRRSRKILNNIIEI